jgi:hypothetical protein
MLFDHTCDSVIGHKLNYISIYNEIHSDKMDKKIVCRRKQVQKNCLQRQQHQKKLFALTKCPFPPSEKIMVHPLEVSLIIVIQT